MIVGEYTYGHENIKIEWGDYLQYNKKTNDFIIPELVIGKFCSIGANIKVYLGGNHRVDWVTTYPFTNMEFFDKDITGHPCTNGDVYIGNDVWIGSNVTIMSGVSIGDGSIISNNSHVSSNIKPYSINGGNPCSFYYYRFDQEVINKLLELKWWNMNIDIINDISPILCSNDIDSIFKKFNLL